MKAVLWSAAELLKGTARDLVPIIAIIGFFQIVVLKQPFENPVSLILGFLSILVGLAIFVRGLEMALFPLGNVLADALARRGSLSLLLIFAFGLGFGTTVAEPALIAVADEAARVMAEAGMIPAAESTIESYTLALRYTVAVSVGLAITIGVMRILKSWPIHWLIIGGYMTALALTSVAPRAIIGIAYDSGGVTTSTITVPLVTALGVGLASLIRGRNPLVDGFGLIAFASLMPIIFVLLFGLAVQA